MYFVFCSVGQLSISRATQHFLYTYEYKTLTFLHFNIIILPNFYLYYIDVDLRLYVLDPNSKGEGNYIFKHGRPKLV